MTRRMRLVVALTCLALFSPQAAANAGTTSNYVWVSSNNGDSFVNYDNKSYSGASRSTVDWAVSILWWNNAEVDKVKNAFREYPVGGSGADPMWLRLNDGGGIAWDSDRGMKTAYPSCTFDTRHSRVYADGDDIMYNITFGRYVLATTHKDFDEACNRHFGDSEGTERDLARLARAKGWGVNEDYGFTSNYESSCPRSTNTYKPACPGRADAVEGNDHRWQNSGYSTYVLVP